MRHPWKLPLAVVCLLALTSLPLLPAPRGSAQAVTYTATDIGTLGGAQSTALGLDECGKVVGESNPAGSGFFHPYFWDGATMTDLGTFGGQNGGATAVNGGGRVAGFAQIATSEQRPYVWTQAAGKADLSAAGTSAAAYDINDANQIVGQWEISPLQDRAFVWTQATGMQIITAPWGTPIAAYGINNAGHIVGTAQTSGGASHAFLSSGGVVTDLGTLGGTNSFAYDLNESGVVVGHANIPSSNASRPFHAFRWTSAGGMQDLGTLGGARSIAYGVNASGRIVGSAEVSPGVNRAFLWADDNANGAHDAGELKDLNTLAPTAGWTFEEARAINDRGQIGATAVNGSGQRRAFLLTPDNAGPSPCDPTPTPTPTPTPVPVPGTLQFSAATYGVGEAGTSATVTVTRTGGDDGAVSVNYATSDGTAAAGSDYTAASGTLNFADGETSKTFSVAVSDDALDETDETVNLTLSNPTGGAALGSQTTAVLTITDNDATPTLSITKSVTVVEGNSSTATATFVVKLTGVSSQTVTVGYDTEWTAGTATPDVDYHRISRIITYAPGETGERNVEVSVIGDTADEPNETVVVQLFGPKNATYAVFPDDSFGTATITDDDGPPSLSIGDATVTEGHTGTTAATFNVTLLPASGQTVTVNYATANGTATAGSDYAAASGALTFNPGETSKTVNVNVNGDTTAEAHEDFFVNLTSPVNASFSDGQGKGTISNDDTALSIADVTLAEGNSGTTPFSFTVTLSHASANAVSVNYAASDGTAAAGSTGDYTAASGTLNFAPGQTSKTVTVNVKGETTFESNETFNITLSDASGATVSDGAAVGTVTNDDGQPSFSVNDVTVLETNSDANNVTATFTVTLSAASGVAASVNYATSDVNAHQPYDYRAASGTLNFAPGETSKTVNVTVVGDALDEPNETFNFNLSIATNANIGDALGIGTIDDNDGTPSLSINDPAAVNEGNSGTTPVAFTVSLQPASGQTVTVNYVTVNGTAFAPGDYAAASGTLTFAPGETSKTVTVNVVGEATAESNETFSVHLPAASNATVTDGQGLGTITNDDPTPTFTIDDVTVTEGNPGPAVNAVFKVKLSAPSGFHASVNWTTLAGGGTATAGSDYTAASGRLDFAPGEVEKTITIAVTGDRLFENPETFYVNLSGEAGANFGDDAQGEGVIINDEETSLVQFSSPTYSVGEAGENGNGKVTITLVRTSGSAGGVVVGGHTRSGTAIVTQSNNGDDYVGRSFRVTFAENETQKTFEVSIVGDTRDEPNEHFFVDLNDHPLDRFGTSFGAPSTATVTITDDDDPPAFKFSADAYSVNENTSEAVIFLKRTGGTNGGPFSGPVSVKFTTSDGTATAGSDYTARNVTVDFSEGSNESGPIFIPITNDTLDEADETVNLTLSDPVGGVLGSPVTAVLTIKDDEGEPSLSAGDVSVSEGDSGTTDATFTVTLSPTSGQTVTVNYATASGTASGGSDYASASGTLTFAPGEASKTVTLRVVGDTANEPDEFFRVNISGATNAFISDSQGVVDILNDDGLPTLSVAPVSLPEGDAGMSAVAYTVSLSAASGQTVTVKYSTGDGTAVSGSDYVAAQGTLTFAPGETSQLVTFQVVGDTVNEADEYFNVTLSGATNASVSATQGGVTILNDDAPLFGFAELNFNTGESAHFVTVTVTRSGDATGAADVNFATSDGTATERKDYTAASGTLRFAAGETSKTFDVLLTEDAFTEPLETIDLTLSNPTGASLGPNDTAQVFISADDDPPPAANPIDNSSDFVRQHYHDFLNREPDADGLAFWVGGIESCGADAGCREAKRVNTSAAFFLSIEFQETGYLVYRTFKAAYGDATSPGVPGTVPVVRLNEFLPDTRRLGENVVVGPPGWEATLQANKNAYMLEFVSRQRFTNAFPAAQTPGQFVDALYSNAGVQPSAAERQAAVDEFGAAATSADAAARARALRRVAEHPALVQAELRRAFVLMQYYGYLRRNPDDAPEPGLNFGGWNFWLGKLNEFNGDAVRAEMVKAFLDSAEYRNRFGN